MRTYSYQGIRTVILFGTFHISTIHEQPFTWDTMADKEKSTKQCLKQHNKNIKCHF